MSLVRCACPVCKHVLRVPGNMLGKASSCTFCGESLVLRAMGNKTILALAGVDGDAPTGRTNAMVSRLSSRPQRSDRRPLWQRRVSQAFPGSACRPGARF
ncbi:MAG: hypothetical protein ACRELF_03185 [Gemmataceae bacterium]